MPRKTPARHVKIARWILGQLFARWVVTVDWAGRRVVHYAYSEQDAREWVDCYPEDTPTNVVYYPVFAQPVDVAI